MQIDKKTLRTIERYADDFEQQELEELLSSPTMKRLNALLGEIFGRKERDLQQRREALNPPTSAFPKKKRKRKR